MSANQGVSNNRNLNDLPHPRMEEGINYYQESCKLYIANIMLTNQELVTEKNSLLVKLENLKQNYSDGDLSGFSQFRDKKKRHRRNAHEIERHFLCPAENCGKSYGSEGSLSQHVKRKHPEIADSYSKFDNFSGSGVNQDSQDSSFDNGESSQKDNKKFTQEREEEEEEEEQEEENQETKIITSTANILPENGTEQKKEENK